MAVRRFLVMLGIASGLMAGGIARADVTVPPALSAGPDMQLVLSAHADGAQVYVCSPGTNEWVLKGPDATLFGEKGSEIGKHYAGPSWELADGSLITGELAAKDPGPDPNAIPWLLLKVKANNGKGLLAKVGAVQRIETVGGLAPKGACKPGDEVRTPYTSTYRFFATKS
jgi:hypothetical protein